MKEAFDLIQKRLEKLLGDTNFEKATQEVNESFYDGLAYAYGEALSIVSEVEAEYGNGWIPCSERLPEAYTRILCLHDDDGIDCGMLAEKTWYCDMDDFKGKKEDVIAWMPLPSPYKPTTD